MSVAYEAFFLKIKVNFEEFPKISFSIKNEFQFIELSNILAQLIMYSTNCRKQCTLLFTVQFIIHSCCNYNLPSISL